MRFIDEYRDPRLARGLLEGIARRAERIGRPVTIMEVCGSHTQAIGRYGIRALLPPGIRLISGPGCPVCVTSVRDVDAALDLAGRAEVTLAVFGDMMRVPGTDGVTLQQLRAAGADVLVVASPLDLIPLAEACGNRDLVFVGIGFETTAPTVAAVLGSARRKGIDRLFVLSTHKIVPPALRTLLADPALKLDGFLCPGHVSTIIGAEAYAFLPEAGLAAVVAGFEPVDILEGIWMLLGEIENPSGTVGNAYRRAVRPEANARATALLAEVFALADAEWRGLGTIAGSGLVPKGPYEAFDARRRFTIPDRPSADPPGCACGEILRGIREPAECPLFGRRCTPARPVGPCMVSSEGTCAARYRYG